VTTYDYEILVTDQNKDFLVTTNRDGVMTTALQVNGETGELTVGSISASSLTLPSTVIPSILTVFVVADTYSPTILCSPTSSATAILSPALSQGKVFDFYNAGPGPVFITTGSTIAVLTSGGRAKILVKNSSPSTASDFVVVPLRGETFLGSTVSTSVSLSNAAYTAFSTNVLLTFTAPFTGNYRIFSSVMATPPPIASATWGLRLNASSGSPTSLWLPQGTGSQFANSSLASQAEVGYLRLERIDTLAANTSYTYHLQGRCSSSSLVLRGDQMPLSIVAELI